MRRLVHLAFFDVSQSFTTEHTSVCLSAKQDTRFDRNFNPLGKGSLCACMRNFYAVYRIHFTLHSTLPSPPTFVSCSSNVKVVENRAVKDPIFRSAHYGQTSHIWSRKKWFTFHPISTDSVYHNVTLRNITWDRSIMKAARPGNCPVNDFKLYVLIFRKQEKQFFSHIEFVI